LPLTVETTHVTEACSMMTSLRFSLGAWHFQNGKATNVELLDAETDLTRTRLERLDARVARARLDFAIGSPVAPRRR
jgi:hypothetical protein